MPRNAVASRLIEPAVRRCGRATVGAGRLGACCAIAIICCAAGIRAQTPFSLINIGANIEVDDARMSGRGGWGLAEQDTLIPGFKNLASLPGLTKVSVLLSGYAEQRRSESDLAARKTRRVMTPSVRAAIPFRGGQGVLSAGFRARRSTQFRTRQSLVMPTESGDIPFDEEFIREGTQFEIPLGLAWRFRPQVAGAVSVNLIRGGIREILNDFFLADRDSNGVMDYVPSSQVLEDELDGASTTFSLLLTPHRRLSLGATFTPAHNLQIKRQLELVGVAARADSTFDVNMPFEWSVGAVLQLSPRWSFGADYDLRAFSEFSGRDDWQQDMLDEWTVSVGFERKYAQIRKGGLRNLPLRFGARFRRWGYRVGGNEIRETWLSLGTGFPLRGSGGHLDLAVSYGWAGDLEKNGLEDRVWRLTVSVAGLEKWW